MLTATYTFGPFSIDSDSRLLFRNAERVPVPPKAVDVLLALLQGAGQLVTKEELLKRVWPDSFVEEGNLARHVFLLRKILGDSQEEPTFIETVPKRGYRFICPLEAGERNGMIVVAEECTKEQIVVEETETADPPQGRRIPASAVIITVLLLGAVAAAGLLWNRWRVAGAPMRSLLVLPFANLSAANDAEYYSVGLTEELISGLSRVGGIRVVPRTTAFQMKGKSIDLRAVGRELEVDAVLDGSVQKEGDRLRIRLSLMRLRDGKTVWSRAYDRGIKDVLDTQEEIARDVLDAVFASQQRRGDAEWHVGTRNPDAHNLYLKANYIRQTFAMVSPLKALALFKQATDLDPGYAEAWAGQASCYTQLGASYQRYPKDVYPLAMHAVNRALELNPQLAYAYIVRGSVSLRYFRDWQAVKRDLEKAVELEPHEAEGPHWLSHYWVSVGRFDKAFEEGRRALRLDPLNFSIGAHQVWVELMRPDYPKAIQAAEPTLRLDPENGRTLQYLLLAYEDSNQFGEAIRTRRRLRLQAPAPSDLERASAARGATGYWLTVVEALVAARAKGPTRPTEIARAYARLGDRPRALFWLEQAVEERDPWTIYLKVDPSFAGLRSDARFRQILRSAGIP